MRRYTFTPLTSVSFLIVALFFGVIAPASACTFGGSERFKPSLVQFEPHPGPAQKDNSKGGDYWEPVPAPVVSIMKIDRGKWIPITSCDDAGMLLLSISLPSSSTYKIDQFGVYFRVVDGSLPDQIFPPIPVVGRIEGSTMILLFPWLDGHPIRQKRVNAKIEAFFVTNGLDIGPSTVFQIKG
jgi:hypothetical protein